jgi:probable HAF family extracellular repeat protein
MFKRFRSIEPPLARSTALAVIALLALSTRAGRGQTAAPVIDMIDLGTLGGCCSWAEFINNSGQVAGESVRTGVVPPLNHGFLWTAAGGMIDLGTLGGDTTRPVAMNATGQVVGWANTAARATHAFSWTAAGGMIDLGTLAGDSLSTATAVNNRGDVVGNSQIGFGGPAHPFLWTATGGMIDLGTLGGIHSYTAGINANGQVVGYSEIATGPHHPFLWTATSGMIDLGTLGGDDGVAYSVNDGGRVIGISLINATDYHGFSWTAAGGMIDLGTLPAGPQCCGPRGAQSFPVAVNSQGQIAGYSNTATGSTHAFLWTAAGGMIDLGTLGGTDSITTGLNDSGEVVGQSLTARQETHAFAWTAAAGMIDLGTLGGATSVAFAVNSRGQIAGYSSISADEAPHGVLWSVRNPARIISDLIASVMSVQFGQGEHLLSNALDSLHRGDVAATCGQMGAFINQVQAQAGKSVAVALANDWLRSAGVVQTALGCR